MKCILSTGTSKRSSWGLGLRARSLGESRPNSLCLSRQSQSSEDQWNKDKRDLPYFPALT